MSIRRGILYLLAAMFVIYAVQSVRRQRQNAAPEIPTPAEETYIPEKVFAASEEFVEEEKFLLIAENGYLNLYRTGAERSLKQSERFDISLFPYDDALLLEQGMEFGSIEEAYEAMENFVG